jgi:hypothetical protein
MTTRATEDNDHREYEYSPHNHQTSTKTTTRGGRGREFIDDIGHDRRNFEGHHDHHTTKDNDQRQDDYGPHNASTKTTTRGEREAS